METLLTYAPLILSLAALAQFWIWLAWKGGGNGRIDLYESGALEVGFDINGPHLALAGVIRPLGREVFIQSMELTVSSEKSREEREFRWLAFKPNFLLPLSGARAWEMSHPFLVIPGDTHRFNIVFHDVAASRELKDVLNGYYHHWRETERQLLERKVRRSPEGEGPTGDLVSEFKRKEVCLNSYTELDRYCYWEQGNYQATLKVISEGGSGDLTRHFRFSLGKQDAKLLKGNCVAILDEPICLALGKSAPACQAIRAEYLKPE